MVSDNLSALMHEVGPAILITHSQSGLFGWHTRIKNSNVKAIVSYEPMNFVFPEQDLPAGEIGIPAEEFAELTQIPIQLIFGDYISAEGNHWQRWWHRNLNRARLCRRATCPTTAGATPGRAPPSSRSRSCTPPSTCSSSSGFRGAAAGADRTFTTGRLGLDGAVAGTTLLAIAEPRRSSFVVRRSTTPAPWSSAPCSVSAPWYRRSASCWPASPPPRGEWQDWRRWPLLATGAWLVVLTGIAATKALPTGVALYGVGLLAPASRSTHRRSRPSRPRRTPASSPPDRRARVCYAACRVPAMGRPATDRAVSATTSARRKDSWRHHSR